MMPDVVFLDASLALGFLVVACHDDMKLPFISLRLLQPPYLRTSFREVVPVWPNRVTLAPYGILPYGARVCHA